MLFVLLRFLSNKIREFTIDSQKHIFTILNSIHFEDILGITYECIFVSFRCSELE